MIITIVNTIHTIYDYLRDQNTTKGRAMIDIYYFNIRPQASHVTRVEESQVKTKYFLRPKLLEYSKKSLCYK
jgi:hypothetical protein